MSLRKSGLPACFSPYRKMATEKIELQIVYALVYEDDVALLDTLG